MKTKKIIKITFPALLIVGLYFMGPEPSRPTYDKRLPLVPIEPSQLEQYIAARESKHSVKPDNEARIIWADSTKEKTAYSIVYLHGFSASHKEGDPVHLRLAGEFGFNLYLPRLSDHGIDTTETLLLFTPDRVWNSAKEALMIGQALGEKVILVSTSTGGTLALKLAVEYPENVHALINLSPNIAINNPAAFLLNDPWGLYIARMVTGSKYRETGASGVKSQYWNNKYRLESVVQLQQLLETTMNDNTFKKVTQPSLTLYYYESEEKQDPEVKVSAMIEMHGLLGTPDSMKIAKAVPTAGAHVLGSSLASKDVDAVYHEMKQFVQDKLHLQTNRATPFLVQN